MSAPAEWKARVDDKNRRAWELMLSDPESALSIAENALSEAEESNYALGLAEARLNVGWCESYLTRLGPAILSFQKALEGFTDSGDPIGVMKALNALGVAYHELGRYEKAMDYYTRSLDEARRRGNAWRESVTLNNIGEICLELGELKEALDYFLRAYETVPEEEEAELVSNVLLNIGSSFHKMENWALAKEFTEKALAISEKAGERLISSRCWLVLGGIAQASDRLELAEADYLKALEISTSLKNEKQRVAVLLELGSLHAQRGEVERALERYTEALAGAETLGAKALIHQAYEKLSEANEALGNYRTALDFYRRYARFEREAQSEETSRKIKNITVQYEVEKSRHEAEIYRLRNIELRDKTRELEEANRQILSMAELGRKITSSLDLDTVISTLYESLERHFDVSVFGIAVHDEAEETLEWKVFIERGKRLHRPVRKLDWKRSYAAFCIRNKATVFVTDAEREYKNYIQGERLSYGPPAASLIFLPLTIESRVIGVLTVQSYEKNAYQAQHRNLLEALGPSIAIAIENGLIHDRLEELNRVILGEKAELEEAAERISHLANHDSLTGLPNRRLLFELLQKSFDIAARSGTKVGVVYVDLDDFKPINDRFGHFAGDRALVDISERLQAILRSSDTVARVGGDEFILVLTNVKDRQDIELAARKILEECGRPLLIEGEECRVGLSMGIAVYPDDGTSIERLVNQADSAMYKIKHDLKNGFCFHC